MFSSHWSGVDSVPSHTRGCGGRSHQSGGGGEGAAAAAGGRGVAESRVVPEDRVPPEDRASGRASSSRSRCSARIRTRPEPAKSTRGWPPTLLNPTTVPRLPVRTLIALARALTRSPAVHPPAAASWPSSTGFQFTLPPPCLDRLAETIVRRWHCRLRLRRVRSGHRGTCGPAQAPICGRPRRERYSRIPVTATTRAIRRSIVLDPKPGRGVNGISPLVQSNPEGSPAPFACEAADVPRATRVEPGAPARWQKS
jgi:hypothetical protein